MKHVERYQWRHQNDINDTVLTSLMLTLTYFTPFSNISIVDFERLFVCWEATDTIGTEFVAFTNFWFGPFVLTSII